MTKLTNPIIGQRIVISDRWGTPPGGDLSIGQVVTVIGIEQGYEALYVAIAEDDSDNNSWGLSWFDVLENQNPVSFLKNDTSKAYALRSQSRRLLSAEHNAILRAAGNGESVDVTEFRKAATSALSAASTAGQSTVRRDWATMARHLIYWADAIIDQHIQGLPVYEPGARSPKIRELEEAVEKLQANLKSTDEVLIAKVEEVANLQVRIDLANQTIDEVVAARKSVDARLIVAEGERDVLAAVLEYALSRSSKAAKGRVHGYWDALNYAYVAD